MERKASIKFLRQVKKRFKKSLKRRVVRFQPRFFQLLKKYFRNRDLDDAFLFKSVRSDARNYNFFFFQLPSLVQLRPDALINFSFRKGWRFFKLRN